MAGKKKKSGTPAGGMNPLREQLIDSATSVFLSSLPAAELPPPASLRHAAMEVQQHLKSSLPAALTAPAAGKDIGSDDQTYLALDFTRWLNSHPIPIIQPAPIVRVTPWKIAASAAAGAFLGQILFSTLFKFLIGQPEAGLLWGGPVGALGMVLLLLSPLTQKLAALFPSLPLNIRRASYDAKSYAATMRSVFSIWIDNALAFLNAAQQAVPQQTAGPAVAAGKSALPLQLGSYLFKLHRAPTEQLINVAAELITEARNAGIEGLDGDPLFIAGGTIAEDLRTWSADMEAQYNAIGLINPGDRVLVEEQPLIRNGNILKKGVVRKKRN